MATENDGNGGVRGNVRAPSQQQSHESAAETQRGNHVQRQVPRVHLNPAGLNQSADSLRKQLSEAKRNHYLLQNVRSIVGVSDLEASDDWQQFYRSWGNLHRDEYMADQGEYRERRYSVFEYQNSQQRFVVSDDQKHFQATNYNALNGGVERIYSPFEESTLTNPVLAGLLSYATKHVQELRGESDWRIESHQFRILASPEVAGKPTPEGIHQDGVDYVFVVMIDRHNVMGGISKVYARDGKVLSSFKMRRPLDVLHLDDELVYHYVTPVKPLWEDLPAWRDVLVLTFRGQ